MFARSLVAALLLTFGLAGPGRAQDAAADARDLARISNYLNATETLAGDFVQIDPDAVVSRGEFFMRRPGRLRFEYEPPNNTLVIADGFWVAVVDKRDGRADRMQLADSPLNLLLRERVNLGRENAVSRIERSEGQIAVTAHDPERPEAGEIVMVFSNDPLALRQWVVRDAQGGQTTVALRGMRTNVPIPNEKFVIRDGGG